MLVNAAGCTNACRHCHPGGRPPIGVFYTLDELREIASIWGPVYPFYEAATHPDFPEIMDPVITGLKDRDTVLSTNGSGLAERGDCAALFGRLREFGYYCVSFTLHGLEEEHDWFVRRKGAFQTILAASRKTADAGFVVHWNVYLNRRNLGDIPALVQLGKREFDVSPWVNIPRHVVSRRLWEYENLRPRLKEVEGLLARGLGIDSWESPFRDRSLEEFTESAWLEAWGQCPASDAFGARDWPPGDQLDDMSLFLDRDRRLYAHAAFGEPILLGSLADGRGEILRRLRSLKAPPHYAISPEEARLPAGDSDLLHACGSSVRHKAISTALFGSA